MGAVVSAWISFDKNNTHKIISLDYNIQNNFDKSYIQLIYDGIFFNKNYDVLLNEEMLKADIVVIHFWNHPLLYDLLFNRHMPECRLVIWCHVSGLNRGAAIPSQVIELTDNFIFTSPVSYNSNDIEKLPVEIRKKLNVVWSSSLINLNDCRRIIKAKDNIKVGYIGTADYSKLNSDFLFLVKNLKLQNKIDFYSNDSQNEIIKQASDFGVIEKISFNGRAEREDLPQIYNSIDVFLYPLNRNHYGTCEQVLGEAMHYGCIPVVLDNKPELCIIKNRKNGIVAADIREIPMYIEELSKNIRLRKKLSINAVKSSSSLYSLSHIVKKWNHIFGKLMKIPKHIHFFKSFHINKIISPAELYAISQGDMGNMFYDYMNTSDKIQKEYIKNKITKYFNSSDIFRSKSKGSVLQYLQFFKDSKVLQEWGKLVEEVKNCQN